MKDLDFRKLKVLLLEGYKDKAKPCYFLACEKLIHLLIQFQHFRMARVVLMVALDVKKELLKQIKPAINSIEHRCLCLQVQFVSYLFLYTSRDLKKEVRNLTR